MIYAKSRLEKKKSPQVPNNYNTTLAHSSHLHQLCHAMHVTGLKKSQPRTPFIKRPYSNLAEMDLHYFHPGEYKKLFNYR